MKSYVQTKNKSKAVILGSATNLIRSKDLAEIIDMNEAYILGGNLCFLEHKLDYFFSSYFIHCELCALDNNASIIKFSTIHEKNIYPNTLTKTFYPEHLGIHPGLIHEGFVCTEFNQLIGMTHFATSLGVDEIFYSGFNQKDYKYFWQSNKKYNDEINVLISNLDKKLLNENYLKNNFDEKVIQNIRAHQENLDSFNEYPFYNNSILKAIFSDLEALKIKFSSFDKCGIVTEILDEFCYNEN